MPREVAVFDADLPAVVLLFVVGTALTWLLDRVICAYGPLCGTLGRHRTMATALARVSCEEIGPFALIICGRINMPGTLTRKAARSNGGSM
ncbi:hypothetical protein LJR034_005304 [Caballeronia sp. LjRoot34]|uniref:hypothetical protein n=1 Tax=Caballeronia sp. LjRoot34 TaxID=3342325 RepID=UPI003ECD75D5